MKLLDQNGEIIQYWDCFKVPDWFEPSDWNVLRSLLHDDPIDVARDMIELTVMLPARDYCEDIWLEGTLHDRNTFELSGAVLIPDCKSCQNFFDCMLKGQLKE